MAVWALAVVWFSAVVVGAEASFPGRNGLIAFAGEGPPFNTKHTEGAWTIRVVNPRSGRTRQLTHVPRRCTRRGWTWSDSEPSYSAAGRRLAYYHEDSCDPRTADGLYIMRADGSERRLIRRMTSDENDIPEYPAISPCGGPHSDPPRVPQTTRKPWLQAGSVVLRRRASFRPARPSKPRVRRFESCPGR